MPSSIYLQYLTWLAISVANPFKLSCRLYPEFVSPGTVCKFCVILPLGESLTRARGWDLAPPITGLHRLRAHLRPECALSGGWDDTPPLDCLAQPPTLVRVACELLRNKCNGTALMVISQCLILPDKLLCFVSHWYRVWVMSCICACGMWVFIYACSGLHPQTFWPIFASQAVITFNWSQWLMFCSTGGCPRSVHHLMTQTILITAY